MRILQSLLAAVSVGLAASSPHITAPLPTTAAPPTSELVLLVTLSRHGSRAPNPSARASCPNNRQNLESYHVPLEELTEKGMKQLEAVGREVRDVYVNKTQFLSPSFNGGSSPKKFEAYFRADAALRCSQSALALGYGLYPDGTGPAGYTHQPIPVFMQLQETETDFTGLRPCWPKFVQDSLHYYQTIGLNRIHEHSEMLHKVANLCGNDFFTGKPNAIDAIKDVADMISFDADEGLPPMTGITPAIAKEIGELAFTHLIERFYQSPEQVSYVVGGFPHLLLGTLERGASGHTGGTKYFSYHCHRELLHGLAFMLGMNYSFAGLPTCNGTSALHPGTTVFFELHRSFSTSLTSTQNADTHFVRMFLWSPMTERTPIKLDKCGVDCPLRNFSAIITDHLAATGAWSDICPVNPTALTNTAPAACSDSNSSSSSSHIVSTETLAWVLVVALTIACVVITRRMTRRAAYDPIRG